MSLGNFSLLVDYLEVRDSLERCSQIRSRIRGHHMNLFLLVSQGSFAPAKGVLGIIIGFIRVYFLFSAYRCFDLSLGVI